MAFVKQARVSAFEVKKSQAMNELNDQKATTTNSVQEILIY